MLYIYMYIFKKKNFKNEKYQTNYRNIGFSFKITSNQIQMDLLSKEKCGKDYPDNHHVNACQS